MTKTKEEIKLLNEYSIVSDNIMKHIGSARAECRKGMVVAHKLGIEQGIKMEKQDNKNKVITRTELFEAISETNAKLYSDGNGSYDWNEILCKKLGIDTDNY